MAKKEKGSINVKECEPYKVFCIEFEGPFTQAGEKIGELIDWIHEHGGITASQPIILHTDNPAPAMMEHWRGDICIEAMADGPGELRPDGDVVAKEIPSTTVAALVYKGPVQGLMKASNDLLSGLATLGYEQAGPFREVMLDEPQEKGGNVITSEELQVPVKKLAS